MNTENIIKENILKKEKEDIIQLYINSFSEKEKNGFIIAKEHLGFSFQIEKSVGFEVWQKNRN